MKQLGISHYIITRFNLNYQSKSFPFRGLEEKWLEDRFELFWRYCFPSVKNQSTKSFKWLCLFHDKTPEKYQVHLRKLAIQNEWFVPFFVKDGDVDFKNYLAPIFAVDKSEYIITTRLDNDDSIHKNFILSVQFFFQQNMNIKVINFYNCLFFDEKQGELRKIKYYSNPFLSYLEKNTAGIETILSYQHTTIKKIFSNSFRSIGTKEPYSVTIIHRSNIVNQSTGRIFFKKGLEEWYGWKFTVTRPKNFLRHFILDTIFYSYKNCVSEIKNLIKKIIRYKAE